MARALREELFFLRLPGITHVVMDNLRIRLSNTILDMCVRLFLLFMFMSCMYMCEEINIFITIMGIYSILQKSLPFFT